MAIFNKFQRAKQVAEILLRYGLDEFFERSNLEKWLPESLSNKLANESSGSVSVYERIRRAMEELGTTYVKLGQMLSDRRDLLPVEMITELQKLQDKVPSDDFCAYRITTLCRQYVYYSCRDFCRC